MKLLLLNAALPTVAATTTTIAATTIAAAATIAAATTVLVQSGEEALASLVEEMKEVSGAPVYDDTPLRTVALRFWGGVGRFSKDAAAQ